MKATPLALAMASALSLAACTTPSGPVEVTRFVAPDRVTELGSGPIFVESAPGGEATAWRLPLTRLRLPRNCAGSAIAKATARAPARSRGCRWCGTWSAAAASAAR